jgi:hypothetical protein
MNNYIEIQENNRTQPYDFGLQQLRNADIGEVYQVDTVWSATPPQTRPEARRFLFQDQKTLEAALDVYNAWKALTSIQQNTPVQPIEIYARLTHARIEKKPISLFIPWGVRSQGQPNFEYKGFDYIEKIGKLLSNFSIPSTVFIMPADCYATEINGIDQGETDRYFAKITQEAEKRDMTVKSWSAIRQENLPRYAKLLESLSDTHVERLIQKKGTMERIVNAARRRSGGKDVQQSAYAYIRERICEATIIEATYRPIKLSLAPKNKDNIIDGPLARLYVIPEKLQLPWLH